MVNREATTTAHMITTLNVPGALLPQVYMALGALLSSGGILSSGAAMRDGRALVETIANMGKHDKDKGGDKGGDTSKTLAGAPQPTKGTKRWVQGLAPQALHAPPSHHTPHSCCTKPSIDAPSPYPAHELGASSKPTQACDGCDASAALWRTMLLCCQACWASTPRLGWQE